MTSPSDALSTDPNAMIEVSPEMLHNVLQEFLLREGERVSLDLDNLLLTVIAMRMRIAALEGERIVE